MGGGRRHLGDENIQERLQQTFSPERLRSKERFGHKRLAKKPDQLVES